MWIKQLFDLLVKAFTQQRLAEAGAGPAALEGAVTVSAELPTFAPPNPEPPLGVAESRDLAHCHPELQCRYALVKADFEAQTGRQLFETCTWRSVAQQQELYQIGRRGIAGERTVTQCDGILKKSRHMVYPSEAVDICVDIDPGPGKQAVWDRRLYVPLGQLAEAHGLVWGGSWGIDDYPHLELPAGAA